MGNAFLGRLGDMVCVFQNVSKYAIWSGKFISGKTLLEMDFAPDYGFIWGQSSYTYAGGFYILPISYGGSLQLQLDTNGTVTIELNTNNQFRISYASNNNAYGTVVGIKL